MYIILTIVTSAYNRAVGTTHTIPTRGRGNTCLFFFSGAVKSRVYNIHT